MYTCLFSISCTKRVESYVDFSGREKHASRRCLTKNLLTALGAVKSVERPWRVLSCSWLFDLLIASTGPSGDLRLARLDGAPVIPGSGLSGFVAIPYSFIPTVPTQRRVCLQNRPWHGDLLPTTLLYMYALFGVPLLQKFFLLWIFHYTWLWLTARLSVWMRLRSFKSCFAPQEKGMPALEHDRCLSPKPARMGFPRLCKKPPCLCWRG